MESRQKHLMPKRNGVLVAKLKNNDLPGKINNCLIESSRVESITGGEHVGNNVRLFSSRVDVLASYRSSSQPAGRVARWFVFKPKIPIWVNFGGP
jgi:hypothetical protein